MTRGTVSLCALLLAAGLAAAAPTIDPARIYRESCSVCHGDDGSGAVWGRASLAVPPRNFRSAESRRELSRERMIASVTAGRPGTPMPGFGTQLSMAEITAVVDWVRAEFMTLQSSHPPTVDHPPLPGNTQYGPVGPEPARGDLPDTFAGDPSRGAVLYASNCVACHGANGRGDGPRAYFIFPKPRNFHDAATRDYLDRPTLYRGIKFGVVGKEMPAWGKVLPDTDIADLAEYVYQQFIAVESAAQGD